MITPESDILKDRHKKLQWWRDAGIDPFGARFPDREAIGDLVSQFAEGRKTILAGRLMAIRGHGKSSFCDLRDESGRIQLFAKLDGLGEENYEQFKKLDVGDIVGVEGECFLSRTGEQSVRVAKITLLSKILQVLPEKWHGLKDIEIRYRRRYVDLIANPEVRESFKLRSSIVSSIRHFLEERGFIEVETPMMQAIPGGARARPFVTHHEALDTDLYLRVAPELYLKRLLVGGFEKVFEINRNFRNEGLSVKHNPEFTMIELYQAYADLRDMMEITESMISQLVEELHSSSQTKYGELDLDFTRPWKRIAFYDALQDKTGIDWKTANILEAAKQLAAFEIKKGMTDADILNELFDHYVEPQLDQPTFIYDYPLVLSPLAKRNPDGVTADRFELFISRMELANAFSELNDPVDQRERMMKQKEIIGDSKQIDDDFLLALEYGMPPAGGLGIGIDRLVMLLTDKHSIRDVLLFPQMRPEKED